MRSFLLLLVSVALMWRPASARNWDLPTDLSTPPSVLSVTHQEIAPSVFRWDYTVDYGQRPTLSHLTLSVCKEVFDTLYDFRLDGTLFTHTEFKDEANPDPITGAVGLKFDDLAGGGCHLFSFQTNTDWEVCDDVLATFKSGRDDIVTQLVTGPCCKVEEPPIGNPPPETPEPASLATLGIGIPFLLKKLRRRADKK